MNLLILTTHVLIIVALVILLQTQAEIISKQKAEAARLQTRLHLLSTQIEGINRNLSNLGIHYRVTEKK